MNKTNVFLFILLLSAMKVLFFVPGTMSEKAGEAVVVVFIALILSKGKIAGGWRK